MVSTWRFVPLWGLCCVLWYNIVRNKLLADASTYLCTFYLIINYIYKWWTYIETSCSICYSTELRDFLSNDKIKKQRARNHWAVIYRQIIDVIKRYLTEKAVSTERQTEILEICKFTIIIVAPETEHGWNIKRVVLHEP